MALKATFTIRGVRVYHGDGIEIMSRLKPESIDFVFTDPPYGHNNNNGDLIHRWEAALGRGDAKKAKARPILNDGPEANPLFQRATREWARLLRCCCCCCCCCCGGGGGPDPQFARWSLWLDEVLSFKQMVIWDKGPMGMGWHYRRSYETVLVANKSGPRCNWFDKSKKIENVIRPGQYGIKKLIPTNRQHPTEKPVALAAHFMKLHSQPGDVVLDCFAGSGSTGVAAIHTGRRCILIEKDKQFLPMIEQRLREARPAA